MKKQIVLISFLFISTFNYAAIDKDIILSKLNHFYERVLKESDSANFNILVDSLLLFEQKYFNYLDQNDFLNSTTFIDKFKCSMIVDIIPNRDSFKLLLSKYAYSSNFNMNYVLFLFYNYLAETATTKKEKVFCIDKSLQYYVGPFYNEPNYKIYPTEYSNEAIKKLDSIATHKYSILESESIKNYLSRIYNYSARALYCIKKEYKDSIHSLNYNTRDDDFIIKHFSAEYNHILDSLNRINLKRNLSAYFRNKNKELILLIGNLNSEYCINGLLSIISNNNNEFEKIEIKAATMALIKLGNFEFTDDINKKFAFDDADYFYMASNAVIDHLGDLLNDTLTKTVCGLNAWMYGEEYSSMEIPEAYKILWMILKSDLIKNLPYDFIDSGDKYDYCFFYQTAKQNENYRVLLNNVYNWIRDNKNNYDLNKQILPRDFLK